MPWTGNILICDTTSVRDQSVHTAAVILFMRNRAEEYFISLRLMGIGRHEFALRRSEIML
jgi:SepF-like predicted cell division protein (DUF552 family)